MKSISLCATLLLIGIVACGVRTEEPSQAQLNAEIDSLAAALKRATANRDPVAYAALHTDSVVFEWPASPTVQGRRGVENLMRANRVDRNELKVDMTISARRVCAHHATEFRAYRESWRDAKGTFIVEYGRYVISFVRQPNGTWLVDRFFGFSDSTKSVSARR